MYLFIRKLLFTVLIFISILIVTLYVVNDYQETTTSVNYTLKSYKNTIALYKNNEIIKIYDSIVLNTLPEKDIQNFNSGISVATQSQAEALLEDYDS